MRRLHLVLVTAFVCVLLTSAFWYAFATTPSSNIWISPGVYPGAPAYTVWREGSNYFAKDANGYVEFSGTNASQIVLNCVSQLTNGGTVKFRAGTYDIDSTIAIDASGIYFEGENLGHHAYGSRPNTAVTLKLTTAGIPLFHWTNTSQQVYFGGLRDLHLWGDSLAGGTGVLVDGASDLRFEYVFIDYFGDHGFDFHASTYGIWNVWLLNCLSESNGEVGYYFRSTATLGIEGVYIQNCYSNNNTYSVYLYGAGDGQPVRNVLIQSSRFVAAREDGIVIEGNNTYRVNILGNRIFDYGKNNATWNAGIRIGVNDTYPFDVLVVSNIIGDLAGGLLPYRNAVKIEGHCTDVDVTANNLIHQASSNINRTSDGGGLNIHHNHGFNTENSGGVTFSAESTKWVSHALSGTPTTILLTPQADPNADYWISSRNSTHFQISFDGAVSLDVFWEAIYVP